MNPLHPLTIPTYRQLFAAMVLTIFAQGAWALYLTCLLYTSPSPRD